MNQIITDDAIHNTMALHQATGGSTNGIMHLGAIAFLADLMVPTPKQWNDLGKSPRIVSVLPNGPVNYPTAYFFLAGGVPEVMTKLALQGQLRLDAMTVTGKRLGDNLEEWMRSERRRHCREILQKQCGINPDDVILKPEAARSKGMGASIICFESNLAPGGALVKSSVMLPKLFDENDRYEYTGSALVYWGLDGVRDCRTDIANRRINAGDIIFLLGLPGMPEVASVTNAIKDIDDYKETVTVVTDARFSGHTATACFGHVTPNAQQGGPIAKVHQGDKVRIVVDRRELDAAITLVGDASTDYADCSQKLGDQLLSERTPAAIPCDEDIAPAVLRFDVLTNGPWMGNVLDTDKLLKDVRLARALRAEVHADKSV